MGEANKILRLQREIYAAYERELQAAGVLGPPELVRLKKKLYRRLSRTRNLVVISREELVRETAGAALLLVGDYHSLPRCQQSAARFLADLTRAAGRPPLLVLECFSTSHDPLLASWRRGSIDLNTLRRISAFDERWGFPWEGYGYLLARAAQEGIEVRGLEASPPRTGIAARDRDMAARLAALAGAGPERQVVAMVGDLHLAREALPTALDEFGLRPLRVFQNMEPLYWRLAAGGWEGGGCDLRLGRESFCILETHPLLKVQSSLNWLDGLDTLGGEEEESEGLTSRFLHLAETIASWLGLPFSPPEHLQVLATDPMEFLEKLGRSGAGREEVGRAMDEIRSTGSHFHPPSGLVYLANPTINEAAEAATAFLRRILVGPLGPAPGGDDDLALFLDRLVGHALGWLGSLLINPGRRPLPTARLARLFAEGNPRRVARTAMALARRILSHLQEESVPAPALRRALAGRKPETLLLGAKILGERIGQSWFQALQEDRLARRTLKEFFCVRPQEKGGFLESLAKLVWGIEMAEIAAVEPTTPTGALPGEAPGPRGGGGHEPQD